MKQVKSISATVKLLAPCLAVVAIVGGLLLTTPQAAAQIKDGLTAAGQNMQQTANVDKAVSNFVNLFLYVVGIVAVIMIIFGGFQFLTSAGDSSKAGKARSTILYALIGLLVAALAYAIINFVMDKIV